MRHVLKSVRRGLKILTVEGFSRLAHRDYKERRERDRETKTRTKFFAARTAAAESTLAPARVRDTTEVEVPGRNSIARGDLTLCIVH